MSTPRNLDVIKNYKNILTAVNIYITKSIESNDITTIKKCRIMAIEELEKIISSCHITDYLLIDSQPPIPKEIFKECCFNAGTLYKTYAENMLHEKLKNTNNTNEKSLLSEEIHGIFYKGIRHFITILQVYVEDVLATQQLVSIYTQLCYYSQHDLNLSLKYLQECQFYAPDNENIHYNMGFIYQKLNKLELSVIHYKLSLRLCNSLPQNNDIKRLVLNNYNGIACIYRGIKQWPESLFYLLKAEKINPTDPDVLNQLGVVYTEMRRTDLAEKSYLKAIKNYTKTFITPNPKMLLSEIHLNLGHMHSYNGNNVEAINQYNKSLQINSKFSLPFQNKIMNMNYLFDQLEDKMYILNQHKLVNKLYQKGDGMFKFTKEFFQTEKINIGIISGDFSNHPVTFFISTFLTNYDTSKYNITCYSECIIDTSIFNKQIKFTFIKNMSNIQAATTIYNDNIHILFDLSGHTAFNRLDVFALKPCPIQITYIGYPYSTGLTEMDYRITDNICDNPDISEKFYTEKLLYLQNCFLCYQPHINEKTPDGIEIQKPHLTLTKQQPFLQNKYITIGCFNRLNKMTDSVIDTFNQILIKNPKVRFVFKTKALLNKNIKIQFLNKFDKSVHPRINIIECTIQHSEHVLEYNNIDIAIDTFPYSGTTTSCEALYMGVPVFTLYDTKYYFHAQNVTTSILKNSDLDYYVVNSIEDLYNKISELHSKSNEFWKDLKSNIRNKFLNGKVCNTSVYMTNLTNMLNGLYQKEADKYNN